MPIPEAIGQELVAASGAKRLLDETWQMANDSLVGDNLTEHLARLGAPEGTREKIEAARERLAAAETAYAEATGPKR